MGVGEPKDNAGGDAVVQSRHSAVVRVLKAAEAGVEACEVSEEVKEEEEEGEQDGGWEGEDERTELWHGDEVDVRALLAEVDATNSDGHTVRETAMLAAAMHGHEVLASWLGVHAEPMKPMLNQ